VTFYINDSTFYGVLLNNLVCPHTKSDSTLIINLKSNGYNHLKIVVNYLTLHLKSLYSILLSLAALSSLHIVSSIDYKTVSDVSCNPLSMKHFSRTYHIYFLFATGLETTMVRFPPSYLLSTVLLS
jgi:hypothetical protein